MTADADRASLEDLIDPEGTTIGFAFAVATRTYTARYLSESITVVTQARPPTPTLINIERALAL